MRKKPGPGDKAPDFELPNDSGTIQTLRSFSGKKLVLYFYPKDDTTGCTKEAIDFNSLKREFEKTGAVVVGVSPDSTASHVKFKSKHKLDLDLVSDEAKSMLEAYGLGAKEHVRTQLHGRRKRTTFLIAPDGTIAKIWNKVKVPDHAAEVLAAAKSMA